MPAFILFLFAFLIFCPSLSPGEEREGTQVFETEGIAAVVGADLARARRDAVRDALQRAVTRATGQWLTPQDMERKYGMLKERIMIEPKNSLRNSGSFLKYPIRTSIQ